MRETPRRGGQSESSAGRRAARGRVSTRTAAFALPCAATQACVRFFGDHLLGTGGKPANLSRVIKDENRELTVMRATNVNRTAEDHDGIRLFY